MSFRSQPAAIAVVGASSAAAAVAGGSLLYALRRRSLAVTLIGTVLTAVAAVFVGVFTATVTTSISPTVEHLMWVATGVAGGIGALLAMLFGWSLMATTRALESSIRQIGAAEQLVLPGRPGAELSGLAVELVRTNERIAEARFRQQALEDSRRELVAWMSHDLRTPLAALRAMAVALEDRVVSDEGAVARYHAGIRLEADRLADMIDDLFELSRVHAGTVFAVTESWPMADLVSDALAAVRPLADSKHISLIGQVGEAVVAQVDPMAFGRVLRNLLTNAVQYSRPGSTVRLEAVSVADGVTLKVADACGGIPPGELDHIFEAGFRGTSPAAVDQPGAGLGLVIVERVMAAHGGTAQVQNDPPIGCRFVLHLPSSLVSGTG